jgi:hypothetical protein
MHFTNDREAGRVVESKEKLRIKGSMTPSAGGREIPGELDLTVASTVELRPAAKWTDPSHPIPSRPARPVARGGPAPPAGRLAHPPRRNRQGEGHRR